MLRFLIMIALPDRVLEPVPGRLPESGAVRSDVPPPGQGRPAGQHEVLKSEASPQIVSIVR
jgi:hypothetical protein